MKKQITHASFAKSAVAVGLAVSLAACGAAPASSAVSSQAASSQPAAEADDGTGPVEPVWYSVDADGNTKHDERTAVGTNGVVTSANVYATQAGIEVLEQGGNAVDAAIAVSYALGVVEPQASGLGGGGFMLVHSADGTTQFIDYREVAPAAQDAYTWMEDDKETLKTDQYGNPANQRGGLAVGVPGEVAGMEYARENFGSGAVTRQQIMQPAIDLATRGYYCTTYQSGQINDHYSDDMVNYENLAAIYLDPETGLPKENGDVITNPDLAKSLQQIADGGKDVFYTGEMAEATIAEIEKFGGVMTLEDLANYEVAIREPVSATYRGYEIISCPPPSSGGTHLIEILNILENFDIGSMEVNSAEYCHVVSEAFKAAFADRAAYMGDTDFVDVPLEGLTSKEYAAEQAAKITDESQDWVKGDPFKHEGQSTTSFSVADKEGNIVTVTQTIECSFGSGIVVPGYGFILNDQMHDFSTDPASVNCVEPGKKPLSSMSPTVVLNADGTPFMTVGTPGATRIFPTIVQIISHVIDHGMDLQDAINAGRIYDNGNGDGICYESGMPNGVTEETATALQEMGHNVTDKGDYQMFFGGVHGAIYLEDGTIYGAADPRRDGKALAY